MAKQIAPAAPPAPPCSNRNRSRTTMLGAQAHNTDATTNTTIAITRGLRRPRLSLSGPMTSWPAANPNMQAVKDDCIPDGVVCRAAAAWGKLGKYTSVVTGPNADSAPSTTSNRPRPAADGLALPADSISSVIASRPWGFDRRARLPGVGGWRARPLPRVAASQHCCVASAFSGFLSINVGLCALFHHCVDVELRSASG